MFSYVGYFGVVHLKFGSSFFHEISSFSISSFTISSLCWFFVFHLSWWILTFHGCLTPELYLFFLDWNEVIYCRKCRQCFGLSPRVFFFTSSWACQKGAHFQRVETVVENDNSLWTEEKPCSALYVNRGQGFLGVDRHLFRWKFLHRPPQLIYGGLWRDFHQNKRARFFC